MHRVEALIDVREFVMVRDVFIDLVFLAGNLPTVRVFGTQRRRMKTRLVLTFHDSRRLSSPLHTSKSGPAPDTPSDQLESPLASQFTTRQPAGETHGRVEISLPAAATLMIVETPHPLWYISRAARMMSTCWRCRCCRHRGRSPLSSTYSCLVLHNIPCDRVELLVR